MSDQQTIDILIKSLFDASGAKAAQEAMERLRASQGGPSGDQGAAAAQGAASSYTALARAQSGLEMQQARLARAQGEGAQAAELEASAQQRLTTLLEAQDTTTVQTIAIQKQLVSAQQQVARASQEGASLAQQFGQAMTTSLTSILGPAALAAGAIGAVSKAGELIQLGAQAQQTEQRFDGLAKAAHTTGDELLRALRAASAGTISDLNLELAANRAQLLGVASSAEQFSQLMVIARARAQDLGTTTQQAFDDIVTGIGRASPRILDNLGIIISEKDAYATFAQSIGKAADALTEAEKKQAIFNAVLAEGNKTITTSGGAIESNASKIERLGAAWDNVKAAIGGGLADEILPTVDAVTTMAQATDGTKESLLRYVDAASTYTGANAQVAKINRDVAASLADLVGLHSAQTASTDAAAQATLAQADASNAAAAALRDHAGAVEQAAQAAAIAAAHHATLAPTIQQVEAAASEDAAMMQQVGVQTNAAAVAAQQQTMALAVQAQQSLQAAIETEHLSQFQATLASLGGPVAAGLINAANAAAMLASQYNITAGEAQRLILLQAQLANAQAAAATGLNKYSSAVQNIITGGRSAAAVQESTKQADAIIQNVRRERDAQLQADMAVARAKGDTKGQIDLLRQSQKGLNQDSAAYKQIEAQIISLQKGRGAGGGHAGGGGKTPKVSAAEQTATRLEDIEHSSGQKLAEIDAQTQQKLADIEKKYAEKRAAAARKLADDIAEANANTKFDQELDDFDKFQKDLTDEQKAALAVREAAEQEYNQKVAAAQAEAQQTAANGDAEEAQAVLDARTKQAEREKEIAEKAAEAKRNVGKKGAAAVDAEAQQAKDAAKAQADTEIAIAQAKAQERAGAEQAEKDAVVAQAEEQKNKVVAAAEESANKVKGASADQKAKVISDLQAQAAAVNAWADTVASASAQATSAMAGVNGPPTSSGGAPEEGDSAAAGGGTFVTQGRTTLTVGDNPGGAELVQVTPLSGKGQTRVGGGLAQMAGGGALVAGGGGAMAAASGGGEGDELATLAHVVAFLSGILPLIKEHNHLLKEVRTYQHTMEETIKVFSEIAALHKALAQPLPPLPPGIFEQLATELNAAVHAVADQVDPNIHRIRRALEHMLAAEKTAVEIYQQVLALRQALVIPTKPISLTMLHALAAESVQIVQIIRDEIVVANQKQSDELKRYSDLVQASVAALKDIADLHKDLEGAIPSLDIHKVEALAAESTRLVQILQQQVIPYSEQDAELLKRYQETTGAAVDIVKGIADLANSLRDPIPAISPALMQRLADMAKMALYIVQQRIFPQSQEQADALKRYQESEGAAVSVLKDIADLGQALKDPMPAITPAMLTKLANVARQAAQIVLQRALPATQEQADALKRYAETTGAAVGVLKNTLDLPVKLFTDYQSPSDAQISRVVADANRIAHKINDAAKAYDTKGLEAAKAFSEAIGGTFSAFKEGLLFFQALNSGDFVLDPKNLAKFETAMGKTIAMAGRLGAQAAAIGPTNVAALQSTAEALTASYDSMIKLSAVPFGNLPQMTGGGGGGSNSSVTFNNTFVLPAGTTQQMGQQILGQLQQQLRMRRQ